MLRRLGFVASVLSEGLSASRTCRLQNASTERLRAIAAANLAALGGIVSFLERHQIRLYRVTSNLIPYGSHPANTIHWWDEFDDDLRRLGGRLRDLDIRVSMHPGQYTVLNSPRDEVVRAAVAELVYQARLLDALGTDASSKIVLHGGGLYGGTEAAALDRFVTAARELPATVRRRLVLENDDRIFDAEEVLDAARAAGIPVVFDWLHHQANPCRAPIRDVLAGVFDTWKTVDGPPKIHMSSQAAHRPSGAHADYVDVADVLAFLALAPPRAFDCMLEAKAKDLALLRLRAELRERGMLEPGVQR
jgi:UV DNA damage endonuclease